MPNFRLGIACLLSLAFIACNAKAPAPQTRLSPESSLLAPLIDPAKLATLGERQANPRIQKAVAILYGAKQDGQDPEQITTDAITRIGWGGTAKGKLTVEALLRNLTIAERLGATTPADIEAMRKGRCPTVRNGPYVGDILSVDHVVPRAVAPELDNVIANLEFMPLTLNKRKQDKIGERQLSLAEKLNKAGLLSNAGFQRVRMIFGRE